MIPAAIAVSLSISPRLVPDPGRRHGRGLRGADRV
jgi:hypothetical protein